MTESVCQMHSVFSLDQVPQWVLHQACASIEIEQEKPFQHFAVAQIFPSFKMFQTSSILNLLRCLINKKQELQVLY